MAVNLLCLCEDNSQRKREREWCSERERGYRREAEEKAALLIVFQKKVVRVCTFELNVTSCKSQPLSLEKPITGIISVTLSRAARREIEERNNAAEERAFKHSGGRFQV